MKIVIAALLVMLQFSVSVQAEQLTSLMAEADQPDMRTDGFGYIHLVFTAWDATAGERGLYYRLLAPDSTVVIDTTRIDDGGSGNPASFPSMALDAAGQVYVVWQAGSGGSTGIYYLRLDTLQDDRDGSAADPADVNFRPVSDRLLSAAGAMHPRLALDAALGLHVVWESGCPGAGQAQYLKIDANGDPANSTGLVDLGSPSGRCNVQPDVAADSRGHAHVVFTTIDPTDITATEEVFYAMLDGADSTLRIAETMLSPGGDSLLAGSATISVNVADGRMLVVDKEQTGSGGAGTEVIVLSELQPGLVTQDGSPVDINVLRSSRVILGLGKATSYWQVFARAGADRRLHILYTDVDVADVTVCAPGSYGPFTINHAHVIFDGRVLVRETLTNTATSTDCLLQTSVVPGGNRLVWADSASGSQEIESRYFSRADAGDRGLTCTLSGHGTMKSAGDAWLLLLGLALLGVKTRLRRQASSSRL